MHRNVNAIVLSINIQSNHFIDQDRKPFTIPLYQKEYLKTYRINYLDNSYCPWKHLKTMIFTLTFWPSRLERTSVLKMHWLDINPVVTLLCLITAHYFAKDTNIYQRTWSHLEKRQSRTATFHVNASSHNSTRGSISFQSFVFK